VVTGSQNHLIFAEQFLVAASQSAATLQQGGDPSEVYAFIDVLGPAIAKHLAYVSRDPTRQQQYQAMMASWKKLAAVHDQLRQHLEQQQQQQMEQQAAQQKAQMVESVQDPNTAIKAAETSAKIKLSAAKTQASMQQKQEKHQQSMVLADAATASSISRENAVAEAKAQQAKKAESPD